MQASAQRQPKHSELKRLDSPSCIVALGGNDALTGQLEGFRERYEALLRSLQPKRVIVIPVPPGPGIPNIQRINDEIAALRVPKAGTIQRAETIDGIHLAASSYIEWKQHIVDAAQAFACAKKTRGTTLGSHLLMGNQKISRISYWSDVVSACKGAASRSSANRASHDVALLVLS
jgi:hypothetical protein